MSGFVSFVHALLERRVRYALIGVAGASMYAHTAGVVFGTEDRVVFLPPDAPNLLAVWEAADACGLHLSAGREPLDIPRDAHLAQQVVDRRALIRATNEEERLLVDFVLTMTGFEFEEVWENRSMFSTQGVEVPVARLSHIVASMAAVGRDKDRLFLAMHEEALRTLLSSEDRT